MRKIVLLSVLAMLVAFPAYAATLPNYAVLKLGAYLPQDDDMDEFDTGINGELAFGHYFTPNVALEFSVGYLNSEGDAGGVNGEITSYPILLSIKGVAPLTGGEFYVIAGGGIYITEAELSSQGITIDSDDTPFGFQLGVGGNFDLSQNLFLGLEGKYFWAKPSFDFLGVASADVHIDGIQATANLGYRF